MHGFYAQIQITTTSHNENQILHSKNQNVLANKKAAIFNFRYARILNIVRFTITKYITVR